MLDKLSPSKLTKALLSCQVETDASRNSAIMIISLPNAWPLLRTSSISDQLAGLQCCHSLFTGLSVCPTAVRSQYLSAASSAHWAEHAAGCSAHRDNVSPSLASIAQARVVMSTCSAKPLTLPPPPPVRPEPNRGPRICTSDTCVQLPESAGLHQSHTWHNMVGASSHFAHVRATLPLA